MTVPWPSRPSQGAYHISQAQALNELGCLTTVLSPAPRLPAWSGCLGDPLRRHLARPARYSVRDVTIVSPRVPFAFPGVARRHAAAAVPGLLSNLASQALRPAVLNACEEARADAILAHGILPWGHACSRAAATLGIDLCFIEHSAEDVLRLRRGTRLGEHYRQIASHARRVLVVGEPMRAHLTDHLELTNVEWIPNGVDIHVAEPDAGASRDCVVLAAGHYYRRKRFEELVDCWPAVLRRHPHARLAIVTNAPQSLRSRVTRSAASGSISLHPLLPASQLRHMMAAATLFALPSTAEAFGLVYAEALRVGTPVLMSADCGLASLVSSPDAPLGWVIDPTNPDSLINNIVDALARPDECVRRGQAGSCIVRERFTWRANASAVLNAFGRPGACP